MSKAELTFNPLSVRVAELDVHRDASPFGLVSGGDYRNPKLFEYRHRLGMRDAPRFELVQSSNWDDPWQIAPFAEATDVSDDWTPESDAESRIADWIAGTRATRGNAVFGLLPAGQYLLVCSKAEVRAPYRITMGNEFLPTPPFMRSLRQESPFYASIVGGNPKAPPDLDQPLIGLAVLMYTGGPRDQGIYFFAPAAPTSTGNAGDPSKDLVFVIPKSGELVLNNGAMPHNEQKELEMWRATRASKFADWLYAQWPSAS